MRDESTRGSSRVTATKNRGNIDSIHWIEPLLSKPNSCPYIKDCVIKVTDFFFKRVCNSIEYSKCFHYASRAKQLKTPFGWMRVFSQAEKYDPNPE